MYININQDDFSITIGALTIKAVNATFIAHAITIKLDIEKIEQEIEIFKS